MCVLVCTPPQTEDLARMYRLFQRIIKGLDPVAEQFKLHVENEGSRLVREVTDELESKKDAGAITSSVSWLWLCLKGQQKLEDLPSGQCWLGGPLLLGLSVSVTV